MKIPSINYLTDKANQSFLRFPLTIISAFIAVVIGVYLTENESDITNFLPYVNVLLTAALGIPVYFCTSIFIGDKSYKLSFQFISYLIATLALIGIYFLLPNSEVTNNTSVPYIRYTIFNIIAHLLVSFVPYLKKGNLNGFWNYNKVLFIRFLTSVLYSGVLYIGLILALTALNLLFNIDIHKELYFEIFIVIIGLFNTWFFVAGIPEDLHELEHITTYPKGLKIFTQYILLPLLTLYLLILYFYAGKIVIAWDWPQGMVAYMISAVAVLGIFTLLLIYPYGEIKENRWIKKFTHAYYLLLFPLIFILFMAIYIRINDYGITINRYIIVLLGVWLSIVALYFSFRGKNIKFIPVSLAIILILMSFGPWSMFSVSEKSQANRLKKILNEYALLENGKIKNEVIWKTDSLPKFYAENELTNVDVLPDSVHNEVASIVRYLNGNHGFRELNPLFRQNIDSLLKEAHNNERYISDAQIYIRSMGLKSFRIYSPNNNTFYSYSTKANNLKAIDGYDYFIVINRYNYGGTAVAKIANFKIDSVTYNMQLKGNKLELLSENDKLVIDFLSKIEELDKEFGQKSTGDLKQERLTVYNLNSKLKVKVEVTNLGINKNKDGISIQNLNGTIYIKILGNE